MQFHDCKTPYTVLNKKLVYDFKKIEDEIASAFIDFGYSAADINSAVDMNNEIRSYREMFSQHSSSNTRLHSYLVNIIDNHAKAVTYSIELEQNLSKLQKWEEQLQIKLKNRGKQVKDIEDNYWKLKNENIDLQLKNEYLELQNEYLD